MVMVACCKVCFAVDTIKVHKDSRLDVLTAKQAQINKTGPVYTPGVKYKGYRLQILATHSREEADQLEAIMLQNFPNEKTYISYQSPTYKLKIGNFFTRDDAENFKIELGKVYDGGIYIVEDVVEYIPKPDSPTWN